MGFKLFRRAWRYRAETICLIVVATVLTAMCTIKPWSKNEALAAASYMLAGVLIGQLVAWAIEALRRPLTDASDFMDHRALLPGLDGS